MNTRDSVPPSLGAVPWANPVACKAFLSSPVFKGIDAHRSFHCWCWVGLHFLPVSACRGQLEKISRREGQEGSDTFVPDGPGDREERDSAKRKDLRLYFLVEAISVSLS